MENACALQFAYPYTYTHSGKRADYQKNSKQFALKPFAN